MQAETHISMPRKSILFAKRGKRGHQYQTVEEKALYIQSNIEKNCSSLVGDEGRRSARKEVAWRDL